MVLFRNTEKVSKVGVKTMRKSWKIDVIACFEFLSYAFHMLSYPSVTMI